MSTDTHSDSPPSDVDAGVILAAVPDLVEESSPPPPPLPERKESKPERPERKEVRPTAPPVSRDMQAVNNAEDASLRAMLEQLGTGGAFKVVVSRVEPEDFIDPATGRRVKTSGMLKTYTEVLDEEFVGKRHGGGKYTLKVHKATGKGDQMTFYKQRTIEIAGDPKLDDAALQRSVAPASSASSASLPSTPPAEDAKVAVAAMAMAERAFTAQANIKPAEADHKPYELMIQQLVEQNANLREEMREVRRQAETRAAQPQNPAESKLLDKLIDQDTARLSAIRIQHESEINMLKAQHVDEIKRLHDRNDRNIDMMRQSFERELSSLKTSQEMLKSVQDVSASTTKEVLKAQVHSLEREVDAKDKELAELRARKDKSMAEQIKELNALKDLMDDGKDDEEDSGVVGQIMSKLPDVMGAAGAILGKGPQAQPAPPQQLQVPQRPQLVRGNDGQTYRVGANNQLIPIKRKPQVVQGAPGAPAVQVPEIPADQLERIKDMLERAFENGTEPEVVAQTAKAALAGREEIFTAVRQLGGVDQFLLKVANLPSTSPLLTQAGKNWVRKVSKALVGE